MRNLVIISGIAILTIDVFTAGAVAGWWLAMRRVGMELDKYPIFREWATQKEDQAWKNL